VVQLTFDFGLENAFDLDELAAAGFAADNADGCARNTEQPRQKLCASPIGAAFDRWGRQRDFPFLAGLAGNAIGRGAGLDFDGDAGALIV
jgi:hypothetical protein